jgi:hypothetical protein
MVSDRAKPGLSSFLFHFFLSTFLLNHGAFPAPVLAQSHNTPSTKLSLPCQYNDSLFLPQTFTLKMAATLFAEMFRIPSKLSAAKVES